MLMNTVKNLSLNKDVGNFEYSWEDLAKPSMRTYLSTSVGRAGFEATKTLFAPETQELAVSMLRNNEIESCEKLMGRGVLQPLIVSQTTPTNILLSP